MRKSVTLQLSRQEAKLLIIWAIQDQKQSYASKACKIFDDRLIDKLRQKFNE
ncbi:hypothetical protein [Acetilactobacillus jinshanensis]|uniref:hypothetical protein n=1 Tax=Acetilactobacillus jinshanensis TaxID=1720083 RepID=UPI0013A6399B|nr:hypothetical protein [Acetilactobacillus jinshanensis]URL61409.1 hypothetical protein HGK75_05315 [uncultured bacterium]